MDGSELFKPVSVYTKKPGVIQFGIFECCFDGLVWFGLVSLFNGISTFVGYLIPKLFS